MKSILAGVLALIVAIAGAHYNMAYLTIGGSYDTSNLVVSLVVYATWIGCVIFGISYAKRIERACVVFSAFVGGVIFAWSTLFGLGIIIGIPLGAFTLLYLYLYGPLAGLVELLDTNYEHFFITVLLYLILFAICWITTQGEPDEGLVYAQEGENLLP